MGKKGCKVLTVALKVCINVTQNHIKYKYKNHI